MDTATQNAQEFVSGKQLAITVNEGTSKEKEMLVRPLETNRAGNKTRVAYIAGARVATKWILTSRIHPLV